MTNEIAIIEQRAIQFHGDSITAVRSEEGIVYVPVRPICDLLGVDRRSQQRRIQRDAVLSDVAQTVAVTSGAVTTPDIVASSRPNTSYMLALPLDYLNGWLFGINVDRVKPEIRDRLIRYQKECYQVLAAAFVHDQVTHRPDPIIDELLNSDSPTAQAYKMIIAMAQMARQQLLLEGRVDSAEQSLTMIRSDVDTLDSRVQLLETQRDNLSPQVDEAQASRISQAVKAIALELGQRSRRNEFGGVYGELYRRFDITSYKMLPANKFVEAMNFLTGWYQSLSDGDVPF